jgi:hypothetical protein
MKVSLKVTNPASRVRTGPFGSSIISGSPLKTRPRSQARRAQARASGSFGPVGLVKLLPGRTGLSHAVQYMCPRKNGPVPS